MINVQLLIYGLAMGAIYALVALGFVLIYNAAGCINFSHGEFAMLAAYIMVTLSRRGLPYLAAFGLTLAVMFVFGGVIFRRGVYQPLRGRPTMSILVATLGMAMFLQNFALVVWGPIPINYSEPFGKSAVIRLGALAIVPQFLLILVVMLVLMVVQKFFFHSTLLGKQFLAVGQDKDMASLVGIDTDRVTMLTFGYGSVLASVAGILVAPVFILTPQLGRIIYLKALAASIVGGFGNVTGAILGGLIIGVAEVFLSSYISSLYRDGFAFLILIIILMVRPQGLFGERVSQKV